MKTSKTPIERLAGTIDVTIDPTEAQKQHLLSALALPDYLEFDS